MKANTLGGLNLPHEPLGCREKGSHLAVFLTPLGLLLALSRGSIATRCAAGELKILGAAQGSNVACTTKVKPRR